MVLNVVVVFFANLKAFDGHPEDGEETRDDGHHEQAVHQLVLQD